MAYLYVSYWAGLADNVPFGPVSSETIETSDTSALSGTIPASARVALFHGTDTHVVAFGAGSPTAAIGNSSFIVPGETIFPLKLFGNADVPTKFAAKTI